MLRKQGTFAMNYERPLLACAACASAFLFVGMTVTPAFAAEPVVVTAERPDVRTKIVKYGDLNIASAQGHKLLLRRVGHAVGEVCEAPDFDLYYIDRACRKGAWAGARPQIAAALERARKNGFASAALTISVAAR